MVNELHIFQIEEQISQIVDDSNHNLQKLLNEIEEIKKRLDNLEKKNEN